MTTPTPPAGSPGPTMSLPADPGLALLLYTAEPGSQTEQALTFLASWATSNTQAEQTQSTPHT